jgi:hypothetical protein
MLAQMHTVYLWCAGIVAFLAIAGSIDLKRVIIDEPELLKAASAVAVHTGFLQFWFAFIRPVDAVGQPWALYCISLFIVAWVVTVRPASKWSAVLCGSCMGGLLASAVCGVLHITQGFNAHTDLVNWMAVFLMACFNLLVLASWSCGNIGRRMGLLSPRKSAKASHGGLA